MRLIFMGTPEFARPSLKALHDAGHVISTVVTQPDRPKGRGGKFVSPPIKLAAEAMNLKVIQPAGIKAPAFLEELEKLKPECIVVVAFGRILPQSLLDLPSRGCINLHASLLPRYRGAAPIQWAIINGEKETGMTTIKMDAGMDTGDILLQERVSIQPDESAGSLSERLADRGAELMLRTLREIESGQARARPQDHDKATMAPMIKKALGLVDWALPASAILNRLRGLDPWPGIYTYYQGGRLRIWKAVIEKAKPGEKPGRILRVHSEGLAVATGEGTLILLELQPANSRRMGIREFLAGHSLKEGERFE